MANFKDYINFYKLAKNRRKSNSDYVKFENFQAGIVLNSLKNKGIALRGKNVLDIGGGRGGYSTEFFKQGADVVSLDIKSEQFQGMPGVKFVLGDALKLPFKAESFDFVFCSSLIEHVKNPEVLIPELPAVLESGRISPVQAFPLPRRKNGYKALKEILQCKKL